MKTNLLLTIADVVRHHPFHHNKTVIYPQIYPESQLVEGSEPSAEELVMQGLPTHCQAQAAAVSLRGGEEDIVDAAAVQRE